MYSLPGGVGEDQTMSDVAFIGLGTMGRGMVRNLLRAGHTVTAWNRTRRPLPAELDKVAQADSIAAAVRGKPVVFVCVTGPDAQRAVYDEALLHCLGLDVLVIDSTTTDPAESVRIAQAVAERTSRYLDAPVFGSKSEAWDRCCAIWRRRCITSAPAAPARR